MVNSSGYNMVKILNDYSKFVGENFMPSDRLPPGHPDRKDEGYYQDKFGRHADPHQLEGQKMKLEKLAMKVIAEGAGQFTEKQEKALLDFSNRYAKLYPNDKVVKLASSMSESILAARDVKKGLEPLPDDVKKIINPKHKKQ